MVDETKPVATGRAGQHATWKVDGALLLVALIWGTTFVVIKQALTEISTLYFLGLRFSLATVCMLPLLIPIWRRQRSSLMPGLRDGAMAGIFLWLGYLLQTVGLKYTTAGNSGFLTGIYVPLVPLFGAAAYRKRPKRMEVLGVLMAATGMLVLMSPSLASDRDGQLVRPCSPQGH